MRAETNRREALRRCGMGLGGLALGTLFEGSTAASGATGSPLIPKKPHFAGKARHVIHFFANGGPSQVDTFDPKPALARYEGKTVPNHLTTESPTGSAMPSPFRFKKYGESGIEVSDMFARVAEHIDDIAVIRSMHADVPNHEPSLLLMNCGDGRLIRPSLGAWVTYGLGTENQNLPAFVVLSPGGFPLQGPDNWRSAFLPGAYQGTYIDSRHKDLAKLIENVRNDYSSTAEERREIDLLQAMNRRHQSTRADDPLLEARIQSFELAYRMQMEAADVLDVDREPAAIREMYGVTVHGRQALMARRLVERGVRFVQLWHGNDQPWDSHNDIATNHGRLGKESDQPIAALLKDLKQRGLLDETLVLWGGEFGRTPTVELSSNGNVLKNGRDHNHYGFSVWMAGGGIKGGTIHGATDDLGFRAVENPVHVHDLHATILWALGFDHEKLTYRHAGRDFRLTDVHGQVIKNIL